MFGKKDSPVNEPGSTVAVPQKPEARPSVIEILKKRRADKMRQIRQLDKEIEQLDHDITFVERYPQHGRMLEFIASRFNPDLGIKFAPEIEFDRSDLYR